MITMTWLDGQKFQNFQKWVVLMNNLRNFFARLNDQSLL